MSLYSDDATNAAAPSAPASPPANLPDTLRFFGRWDLRAPDKAITVNNGSYVCAQFTSHAISALFDISVNQAPLPTITWRIDKGKWQEAEIAPKVSLADGLSDGPHTLMLMMRGDDPEQSRWTPPLVASYTFLGLDLPDGGQLLPPLDEWDHPKLKIEFLGDSITEGLLVEQDDHDPAKKSYSWRHNALDSYAAKTALLLDAVWRQVGFGNSALLHMGSGGVPIALTSFNLFYEGCPRDEWQPDLVVINQGTNDKEAPVATYRPLYAKYLKMIRKAYPNAKIAALRPFSGRQEESIKAEVEARKNAGDNAVFYIDTTGWYVSDNLHPQAKASAVIAEKLVAALKTDVLNN